jgi:aerobic-type carbon monoxide dehydrogenase small subunit (CoxS/CutS family)
VMSTDSEHKSAGEFARQADPDRRSVLQGIVGAAVAGTGLAGAGLAIREAQQTDPRRSAIELPNAVSSIRLAINGSAVELTVPNQRTLLLSLREDLGLTATKKGCNIGQCGACTILLDGAPGYSCMTLAKDAVGHDVTTLEGLERNGILHPVQQGFIDKMGSQCGMCTNGMIMCGVGLLQRNPSPSAEEIRLAISGVLCRCGNYPHEVESILAAAGPAATRSPVVTLAGLLPPFPNAAPVVPAVIEKVADSARLRSLDVDRPALDGFAKATGRARYAGDFGFSSRRSISQSVVCQSPPLALCACGSRSHRCERGTQATRLSGHGDRRRRTGHPRRPPAP